MTVRTDGAGRPQSSDLDGLIDDLRAGYGELDALSQRQIELIERDDLDALLDLLREREALIDRIRAGSERLSALQATWEAADAAPGERDRLRTRIEALASLARRIVERDDADRRLLETRRDKVADALAGVGRGRVAVTAYADPRGAPAGARFQDRKA